MELRFKDNGAATRDRKCSIKKWKILFIKMENAYLCHPNEKRIGSSVG
jgi:hypothetical protein